MIRITMPVCVHLQSVLSNGSAGS